MMVNAPFSIYFQHLGDRSRCDFSIIVSLLVTTAGCPAAADPGRVTADLELLGGRAGGGGRPSAPPVHLLPPPGTR